MRNVFGLTVRKAFNPLAGKFLIEHEDLLPNESKIADIIGTALEELRGGAFGQGIMNALSSGNAQNAIANLDWGKFGQTLSTMRMPLEQQLAASGKGEAKALGDVIGNMAFNVTDPRAVEWASQRAGEMVVTMSQSVKDDVRGVITQAFIEQTNPRDIAGMIDRQVGLFPRWAQAVENRYQTSLTGFMGGGLSYGEAHDRAQNLADAYRERLIDKRCQMIARTEVIRAANEGRALSWVQATEAGLIDPATTTKEWVAEADACDDCDFLNEEQVWLEESFSSGDDMPPAHPNCRCSAVLVPDGEPTEKPEADKLETDKPETDTLPAMTLEDITPESSGADGGYAAATFVSDDPDEIIQNWNDRIGDIAAEAQSMLDMETNPNALGDVSLGAIYERQGFNELPQVIPREEFDQMRRESSEAQFIYRGIADTAQRSAAEMTEQYRSGEHYPGYGIYGNGTYTTTDRSTAMVYTRSPTAAENGIDLQRNILDMMVNPNAKIGTLQEVESLQNRLWDRVSELAKIDASINKQAWTRVVQDPGRAAALMGYDGYTAVRKAETYYVVLNRSAVTVAAGV